MTARAVGLAPGTRPSPSLVDKSGDNLPGRHLGRRAGGGEGAWWRGWRRRGPGLAGGEVNIDSD